MWRKRDKYSQFNFQIFFFSLKIMFGLANIVDLDLDTYEMQYYAAFHLGLHCLPKYAFRRH